MIDLDGTTSKLVRMRYHCARCNKPCQVLSSWWLFLSNSCCLLFVWQWIMNWILRLSRYDGGWYMYRDRELEGLNRISKCFPCRQHCNKWSKRYNPRESGCRTCGNSEVAGCYYAVKDPPIRVIPQVVTTNASCNLFASSFLLLYLYLFATLESSTR